MAAIIEAVPNLQFCRIIFLGKEASTINSASLAEGLNTLKDIERV